MKRSIQWPLMFVVLGGGIVLGRWGGPSEVQGQFAQPVNVPKELTSYRDVVKAVVPAVVSVVPKGNRPTALSRIPENIPEEFRKHFEEQLRKAPPNPDLGFGSGFIVDPSGVVLTNYHVVEGADSVEITTKDGHKFTSTDFKGDPFTDIAIIRFKSDTPLTALQFGDSSEMEVGDRVLAVGAPFGMAGSVTHGIISAKGRDIGLNRRQSDNLLQTDAAVNPGNSGGPLINMAGQVIGVTNAIKSRTGVFNGIAYAISGNQAKLIMQQLLKDGVIRRGYLGIEMPPQAPGEVETNSKNGIEVYKVFENTPASKAGLKIKDVIVAIGGKHVRARRELQATVAELPLNQAVTLDIIRDGAPLQLSLTIEEAPSGYGDRERK